VADPRSGIIFVGRLVEKKGVPDLLRAVGMLPEPYRAVPITVVGYGPLLAELRKSAAELGLDVTFLGRRTSAEIADLLRVHAIFCGPSQRAANGDAEGLGMVFIEAALAGLPVVAYRHGGVVEAVDDLTTGLLAPEGDVGILSSNLAALLSEPDRAAALGRAGARRAADLFELSTQAAELERLYDHIAAVHAGDPGPTSPGSRTTDQLRGAGEGELTFQYEHEMPMKGQS
jgi:glycosyltransferase involved in cell wall biosynthesis